jgi:hypothetical protein
MIFLDFKEGEDLPTRRGKQTIRRKIAWYGVPTA